MTSYIIRAVKFESTPRSRGPTDQDHFSPKSNKSECPAVFTIQKQRRFPLARVSPLRRQVTRERTQRAPLRLQRYCLHTAVPHAVPELMQTRQRGTNITTWACPEHLSGRSGAGPHDRVKVLRARLLCPEQLLPSQHE
jgi:hypothetical protein